MKPTSSCKQTLTQTHPVFCGCLLTSTIFSLLLLLHAFLYHGLKNPYIP